MKKVMLFSILFGLMVFLSCIDVYAVSVVIGDKDGFGYTNVSSLLGFDGLPADRNGDGILGAGDVLPDINHDGAMQILSGEIGDVFDNRSVSEKDPLNGARWTDITLSAYAVQMHAQFPQLYNPPGIADDSFFTFTFDVPSPGSEDYGRSHYVSFLYGDYDVEPMYAVVEGQQVVLSGNSSAGTFEDGLIWRAYFEIPWEDMLDGVVTIEIIAPNEPFIAFDYAQLALSPIQVPIELTSDAGPDMSVYLDDLPSAIIHGKAIYNGTKALNYRWYSGSTMLLPWSPVSSNMDCNLTIPQGVQIPVGTYPLTLQVSDGEISSTDNMTFTILPNPPAVQISADAGPNIAMYSENLYGTTIYGKAQYTGSRPLTYRWYSGQTVLLGWTPVSQDMGCNLTVPLGAQIPTGTYTLTLEVTDGVISASDPMIFTLNNTAPHAAILGGGGTYEYGAEVFLGSEASDFDGDILSYEWKEDDQTICAGTIQSIIAGSPVQIPYCTASGLMVGQHTMTLSVSDGVNGDVSVQTTVNVIDSTAPTLAPFTDAGILWPPNHKMVTVEIVANASDSSGMPVSLSATVSSNEPENGLGDGDVSPDWTTPVINQQTGIISLQLRAERSGSGIGRTYTITIYATDTSGNQSSATIKIIVPHDKG